ncbi:MAG: hypothetical protein Fur0021_13820 [Candidatus Promineifilaceae bacterium]
MTPHRCHVSFVRSHLNYLPLSAAAVDRIVQTVMLPPFDRLYSRFYNRDIQADAKRVVQRSAMPYKQAIGCSL